MKISKIYIATHKYDMRFTRICVASIRYWYPEIPIYLIKDYLNGDFNTGEIEDVWNVGIFETDRKTFGWGFSKLEPLFSKTSERFLILDSDIVFSGRVLDYLNEFDSDFVVQFENQSESEIERLYFSTEQLREWDPSFVFPNYTFNSGQVVGTGGLILRSDFDGLINWNGLRLSLKHPEVFTMGGDQGILNYVLLKKAAQGQITIARVPFMKWFEEELNAFDVDKMTQSSPYPFLIHWAGRKKPRLLKMLRGDILLHFEDLYYRKITRGALKKRTRIAGQFTAENLDLLKVRSRKVIPKLIQLLNDKPAKTHVEPVS